MKLSKKFSDYIFTLARWTGMPGWYALVTPREYFEKTGCQYDQHLPIEIPGWFDEMEGCYSPEEAENRSPQELFDELVGLGLEYDEMFAEKMSSKEFTSWAPPEWSPVPQAATSGKQPTTIKVETEDCLDAIALALAYHPTFFQWASAKWKRLSKKFSNPNTIRTFECKDPACPIFCQTTDNSAHGIHHLEVIDKATGNSLWCVRPVPEDLKAWAEHNTQKNEARMIAHKGSGKYRFFNIALGYVESSTIGSLFVSHNTGFASPEEGLRNFLDCTKTVLKHGGHPYSAVDCEEYLQGLLSHNNDSWGYDDWEKYEAMGWHVPASPVAFATTGNSEVVFVHNYLWGVGDVEDEDCSTILENENACLGEWCVASLSFPKKFERYVSKAAKKRNI